MRQMEPDHFEGNIVALNAGYGDRPDRTAPPASGRRSTAGAWRPAVNAGEVNAHLPRSARRRRFRTG
jgi:hypothetical protein